MEREEYIKEEIRDGVVVSTERKKIWWCLLELLQEFDRVCREHSLQYYVDSGTLLGAIRHKGFIPWDDDLDIVMLREDYDKLLRLASEFQAPFFLQNVNTDVRYTRVHSQLRYSGTTGIIQEEFGKAKFHQGIFLDVFPLDGLPAEKKERRRFVGKLRYYVMEMTLGAGTTQYDWLQRLIDFNSGFYPLQKRYKKMERLVSQYSVKDPKVKFVEKVAFHCNRNMKLYRIRKEAYKKAEYKEFEFLKVPVPMGWDHVLRAIYGKNYMTPIRGGSEHEHMILDAERPYQWYIAQCKERQRKG